MIMIEFRGKLRQSRTRGPRFIERATLLPELKKWIKGGRGLLAMTVVRKFLKREEFSIELNLTCLPIFIKSYSQNSKSRMVRPGNKTKIVCSIEFCVKVVIRM